MSKKLTLLEDSKPWYHEGLRFECTGCGQCCTGAPGYTWVTETEIEALADYLKISVGEFYERYVRHVGKRLSLLEDPKNYDCIFLKDKRCQVYPVRPKQCRTFPWWPKNLKSKEDWLAAAACCEGISSEAPLVAVSTIQEQLAIQEGP